MWDGGRDIPEPPSSFIGFHTTCHLLINYQLMEEQFNCMAHKSMP